MKLSFSTISSVLVFVTCFLPSLAKSVSNETTSNPNKSDWLFKIDCPKQFNRIEVQDCNGKRRSLMDSSFVGDLCDEATCYNFMNNGSQEKRCKDHVCNNNDYRWNGCRTKYVKFIIDSDYDQELNCY